VDSKVKGLIRGLEGVDGLNPQIIWGRVIGVLKDASFVRAVNKVLILAPRCLGGGRDGDVVFGGKLQQSLSALKSVTELGESPGGNDLERGVASLEGELKSDLIIAFTGAAVAYKIALVLLGSSDLGTSNDWASQSSPKEVTVLINGVALDSAEDDLLDEFLLKILDNHLLGTKCKGLLLNSGKILLLADICEEANDGVALKDQPFQNGRRVQASGVGQTNATFGHDGGLDMTKMSFLEVNWAG